MQTFFKKILGTILLVSPFGLAMGESVSGVSINEVAWMGTVANSNAEWIELWNSTAVPIDLTGWRLEALDGAPKILLVGSIEGSGFFLLERTSDETVPEAAADQIYSGALGNTGELLVLYDALGKEVDRVNGASGWAIGGDNESKQTLERGVDGSFQNSAAPGGTPRAQNSEPSVEPLPEADTIPPELILSPSGGNYSVAQIITLTTNETAMIYFTLDGSQPSESSAVYSDALNIAESTVLKFFAVDAAGNRSAIQMAEYVLENVLPGEDPARPLPILINEFIPNPVGLDSENEWIEIFNSGSEAVDLTGFEINGVKISAGTIEPQAYQLLLAGDASNSAGQENVLAYTGSWKALTNTGGEIVLKNKNGEVLDRRTYETIAEGQSFGRNLYNPEEWQTFSHPTPGVANTIINNAPIAVLTVQGTGNTSGDCKLFVNLTAENSTDPDGDKLTYLWDFGNGSSSTEKNPAGFYFYPGSYRVLLTVTDAAQSSVTAEQTFSVSSSCSSGGGGSSTTVAKTTTTLVQKTEPVALRSYEQIKLLITEVAFNSSSDWVKVLVLDDGAQGAGTDLGGFYFEDDKNFKELAAGTVLKTGEFILLNFDSNQEDARSVKDGVLQLYTDKAGLTATDEQIILKDPNEKIKDAFVWENRDGKWSRGEDADVAALVAAGAWNSVETSAAFDSSLVRKEMAVLRVAGNPDTNSQADWELRAEVIEQENLSASEVSLALTETIIQSSGTRGEYPIRISRLLPDPEGADAEGEWLELQNYGAEEIDLAGCQLVVGKKSYKFSENSLIAANGYLLLPRSASGLTLTNSGGSLALLSPAGELVAALNYGKAKTGQPFVWDGEAYVLESDSQNLEKESSGIKSFYQNGDLSDMIVISEVLPNPAGKDSGNEWIEIQNIGTVSVSLGNWQLDDSSGGSKPFLISETIVLEPGDCWLFAQVETKLALNNTGKEAARLFDWQGQLVAQLDLENIPEGQALARDGTGEYRLTDLLTPGYPNEFEDILLVGKIIELDAETFQVLDSAGEITVQLSKEQYLAAALSHTGSTWKVLVAAEAGAYTLKDFEIKSDVLRADLLNDPPEADSENRLSGGALSLILAVAFYLFTRLVRIRLFWISELF